MFIPFLIFSLFFCLSFFLWYLSREEYLTKCMMFFGCMLFISGVIIPVYWQTIEYLSSNCK